MNDSEMRYVRAKNDKVNELLTRVSDSWTWRDSYKDAFHEAAKANDYVHCDHPELEEFTWYKRCKVCHIREVILNRDTNSIHSTVAK